MTHKKNLFVIIVVFLLASLVYLTDSNIFSGIGMVPVTSLSLKVFIIPKLLIRSIVSVFQMDILLLNFRYIHSLSAFFLLLDIIDL